MSSEFPQNANLKKSGERRIHLRMLQDGITIEISVTKADDFA